MSSSVPPPRPALVRTADGAVQPAMPHLSSLVVDESAVATSAKKEKKKGKSAGDEVTLTVVIPKRQRKRLRRKAESYGWTPEEAAAHVLRVWADS